jgi:hypothetical protein
MYIYINIYIKETRSAIIYFSVSERSKKFDQLDQMRFRVHSQCHNLAHIFLHLAFLGTFFRLCPRESDGWPIF